MTTDITELAQREKFEAWAEECNALPWGYLKKRRTYDGFYSEHTYTSLWAAWKAASAELVEALEKAQRANGHLREQSAEWERKAISNFEECAKLSQRVEELESRSVTVKQGEVLVTVAGFTGCGKSAIAGEIEIAMKAIGVPVTWANGDSEKRMTGADWLTAIEMYKPTVRIVEVNIPRAAGIKVEAE